MYVEIIVWDTFVRSDMSAVEEDALVSILEPLKQLAARSFEVELNFAPPDIVLNRLGELPFRLIIRKRPYDRIAFPL